MIDITVFSTLTSKKINTDLEESAHAPFVIEFTQGKTAAANGESKRKKKRGENDLQVDETIHEVLKVSSFKNPNMGPYPESAQKMNATRFTPVQGKVIVIIWV